MEILHELCRLPDKEIKEKLDNNKYIKEGAIAVHNNKDLVEILARKGTVVILRNKLGVTSDLVSNIDNLTYPKFKEIVSKKYTEGTVFQNLEAVAKYLRKSLVKVYGEDRVDISSCTVLSSVKVYFPKVVVKNSLDMEHTITDVYLEFKFQWLERKKALRLYEIILFRATFTPAEVGSGYIFSHANGTPGSYTSSWCFGGTNMSDYIKKCDDKINPKDVLFLVSQLYGYMQWESIAGVPYKYISDIKPYKIKKLNRNLNEITTPEVINKYTSIVLDKLENFTYTNIGDSGVTFTDETNQRIKSILNEHIDESEKYRNIDGVCGDLELYTKENTKYLFRQKSIVFLDKEIYSEITDPKESFNMEQLDQLYPKEVHPTLLKIVTNKISTQYMDFLIKYKLEND